MTLRDIKIAIMDSDLNQQEVAKRCKIHFTTFNKILKGTRQMPEGMEKKLQYHLPSLED